MKSRVHAAAGLLAMACIATFWVATLVSELFLAPEAIVAVKRFVVQGLAVLIPALAITASSGFSLSAGHKGTLAARKLRRMRVIAANGLLVLVPAAFFLRYKAALGAFDPVFVVVQCVELAAGALNLWLMALNARDGLRLSGRLPSACRPRAGGGPGSASSPGVVEHSLEVDHHGRLIADHPGIVS